MPLSDPRPPDASVPRYSPLALPSYRFVPGFNAHPRVDPAGHSFGQAPAVFPAWRPEEWRTLAPWLHAVDLYNQAFWWESHEVLEGLWHAAGRTSDPASFVHGILHVAVANLNRHRQKTAGAERQARKALAHLQPMRGARRYMGLDVEAFAREVQDFFFEGRRSIPAVIRLDV